MPDQKGERRVEVTPEMVEAGGRAITSVVEDLGPYLAEALAERAYVAMQSAACRDASLAGEPGPTMRLPWWVSLSAIVTGVSTFGLFIVGIIAVLK